MVQWLGALNVLTEAPDLIPALRSGGSQLPVTPVSGIQHLPMSLITCVHVIHTHKLIQAHTDTHKE